MGYKIKIFVNIAAAFGKLKHPKAQGPIGHVDMANVVKTNTDIVNFSRFFKKETVHQQIQRQMAQKLVLGNPLKQFAGLLSDVEGSLEEELKMLRE